MKTALITGATGCVGRNIVDVLLEAGWDVTVLHRKTSNLKILDGCKVQFQEVDLYDLDSVLRATAKGADAIFHVAGNTSHGKASASSNGRIMCLSRVTWWRPH